MSVSLAMIRRGRVLRPTPPPVAITDSFDRADSSSTLGSTDTGQAWIAQNGTWGIASNKAYCPSFGESAAVDTTVSNFVYQVTVSTVVGHTGIIWRSTDNGNFWVWDAIDGSVSKKVGGTLTTVLAATSLPVADGDVLRVTTAGGVHALLNVTTSVTQSFTDTFNSGATRVGLWTGSNAARFDNLSVTG